MLYFFFILNNSIIIIYNIMIILGKFAGFQAFIRHLFIII